MSDNRYSADYAKRVAGCKKCKKKIDKGELRLAKLTANPFSDGGDMKLFHHPECLFDTFKRARATTKVIEEPGDIEDFQDLKDEDKDILRKLIRDSAKPGGSPKKAVTPSKAKPAAVNKPAMSLKKEKDDGDDEDGDKEVAADQPKRPKQGDSNHKDNSFREFRRLCAKIADEPSYNSKTEIVSRFLSKGTDGKKFQGDLYVWVRLLLPGVVKRIYNLQSRQLVKIFSRIFCCREEDMLNDLEAGDVAETVSKFFEQSQKVIKSNKSQLTMHQVDDFLDNMTTLTREEDQQKELAKICKLCTVNDLKMVIRLIKADLRIQAGAKHILDGLHKDAYAAFNNSRNIIAVIDKVLELRKAGTPNGPLEVGCALMHPVQPMLAMACKSVDMAFQKCPNGMYAEIKYDGERVQLHKQGKQFKYFSRSLKPVLPHKVRPFADHIPKAFPDGSDLILDAEVLMVDNKTGDPLPFGTLGVHKAAGFKDATPCLFVFDCIFYNGRSLMGEPISERRKHLKDHMKEVGNHVKFSELTVVTKKQQLGNLIKKVLKQGLEGLVLKDAKSPYEPGKRHWLKVKKDYLNEGAMADSADLVVLGAWYGTGNKGGIMSIFLMGCYDKESKQWCTVTKVHTGVDEATLDKLQGELQPNMVKIKGDYSKVPLWLNCTRQMTPDFVAKDPKKSPVWEISGAEFTKAEIHTADGISIRFPRITRRRDDKDWKTATDLEHLKALFKASKEANDFDIEYSSKDDAEIGEKEDVKAVKDEPDDAYDEDTDADDDSDEDDEKADTKVEMSQSKGRSYNKTHIAGPNGLELYVVKGDLFSAGKGVSLAHCISRDCRLGKGIAKLFRNKFGRVKEIEAMKAGVGEVAPLKIGEGVFIYNLVTKEKYSDKPTYESLEKSLICMREHADKSKVKEIAMPKIGCGLDGLQWNAVRTLVKNVFLEKDVRITVYSLDGSDDGEESVVNTSPRKATKLKSPPPNRSSPTKRKATEEENNGHDAAVSSPKKQMTIKDMFSRGKESQKRKRKSDGESSEVSPEKAAKVDDDLPNIFDGFMVVLNDDVNKEVAETLQRYVVAYGGEVLDSLKASEATHIVYGSKKKDNGLLDGANDDAQHVYEKYLLDSIKAGSLQKNMNKYKVG